MTLFSGIVMAEDTSGSCYGKQKEAKWWCEIKQGDNVVRIYKCNDQGSVTVVGYCNQDRSIASTSVPGACSGANATCTMNPAA